MALRRFMWFRITRDNRQGASEMNRVLITTVLFLLVVPFRHAQAGVAEGYEALSDGDYRRAREELTPAAGAGDATAAYYIGLMFWEGMGVPRNPATAVSWLASAAERGHSNAQLILGLAYANGDGVIQDFRLAARWMMEAAERGNADAQYHLGSYYHDGRGIAQDNAEAYDWVARSVEYGIGHDRLLDGFLFLGAAREWGRGVPQDLVEAYKWFVLAAGYSIDAAQTYEEAGRAMGALSTRMRTDEMEQAHLRAQQWIDRKRGIVRVD